MKIDYFTFVAINFIRAFDYAFCFDGLNYFNNDSRPGFIFGDYMIGALLPIHDVTNGTDFNYNECYFITENGIQVSEAALFAIDFINKNKTILPNVTLGIHIIDYCGSKYKAEDEIKNLISGNKKNGTQCACCTSPQKDNGSPLIGIIGPESHWISEEVADFLNVFEVIQIFYNEPFLVEVTDRKKYRPYLYSVTPEKKFMTEAIFDILTNNSWTIILFIYDDDLLGEVDLKLFNEFATNTTVCIANVVRLIFEYDIKQELSTNIGGIVPWLNKVDAIVCYCSPYVINLLLDVVKENLTRSLVVIGGNGWLPKQPRKHEYRDLQVEEIVVSMEEFYIKEFDDYFLNLSGKNNTRNPWFTEFWQKHFECSLDSSNSSEYPNLCFGNETLIDGYKQNSKVYYVVESVFVLAYALRHFLAEFSDNQKSNFERLRSDFMLKVARVRFDLYGESFKFDFYHDAPAIKKFNIHNLQLLEDNTYGYVKIGEYIRSSNDLSEPHNLTMNISTPIYPKYKAFSKFNCNASCSSTQARALKEQPCCYECKNCEPLDKLVGNSSRCEKCKDHLMPDLNKTNCIDMPTKGIEWHEPVILGSLLFSSFDITLTVFTFYVFIKNRRTPVVKSSTKELSYMMLFGMISANLLPFTILLTPNYFICVIVRILPPISFALIYAALLVKTNRIARILTISKKKFPKLNPKFLSLRAQIVFTILLVVIEASICSYSFFHFPIKIVFIDREENNGSYHKVETCLLKEGVLIETFVFLGGLILICTYYAVKTRNLPENFNEAKYIGFAMYATILTDISFGLIYFKTDFKIFTINLFISANTLIAFIFLFAPKLYVILCTPEKNTRANFITTSKIRCSITSR